MRAFRLVKYHLQSSSYSGTHGCHGLWGRARSTAAFDQDFHHWCGNGATEDAQVAATYGTDELSQVPWKTTGSLSSCNVDDMASALAWVESLECGS